MKSMRSAAAVATLVLAVVGVGTACSVDGTEPAADAPASAAPGATTDAATSPTEAEGAVGAEELAVEAALRAYQAALATGDVATACGLNAPETSVQLVAAVLAAGGQVGTCEEALGAVLAQPGARETATEAASTTTVQDVVVEGLDATITWTSQRQGQTRTDEAALQSIAGQWRLVGTPA
ncbi:MAG: hypothetical protein L0H64_15030 [Pseudonocardia sp.]|nr:hypothetical protein [Pseudonocardia sp.]